MKGIAIALVLVALIGSGTALAVSFGHHRAKPSACVDTYTTGFGSAAWDSCDGPVPSR